MAKLPLTVACTPYDRVRAIIDGRVKIEGCDIEFFSIEPEEAFHRAYAAQDFDVTEISASSHILTTARGDSPYVAVPVPILQVFRHSSFYIRKDRGINTPEDLCGKLVGVPEYQMTAALWGRGLLSDEYGVKSHEIRWRNGGLTKAGRSERTPIQLPPEFDLAPIPSNRTLSECLAVGELDALFTPRPPACFLESAPNVVRLFPDYHAAEMDYFRKTKLFPIMHLIAIRRRLVDDYPWLAASVFKAFVQARAIGIDELKQIGMLFTMLPWLPTHVEETVNVMGKDFWPYGYQEIKKEIDAMLRWSVEQGLSRSAPTAEQVFARGTLDYARI